ncbi:MAG: UDP-N-acetylmuramoyl-L-alanyl-D-glutamate--2,6-diaminopimelate ligase [Polyangiaceae bacterium]|nr:UDP-N-acetylmuramoyl-L-alanyl-D-glutamate--2,6-diaminopimelate ligase [Polyangiaceae bacterium]
MASRSTEVALSQALSVQGLVGQLQEFDPHVYGDADGLIFGISEDSRSIKSGYIFLARRGEKSDGTKWAVSALQSGAVAVLCERGAGVKEEPRIEVNDLRRAWGVAAQAIYGQPTEHMNVIGVTGTNGKTTVAVLLEQAYLSVQRQVARSGTLGFYVNGAQQSGSLTTPMPDELARNLASAQELGCSEALLEVSSHALVQGRVEGIRFQAAAFTNLSQDHLDYHHSMKEYFEAKKSLFLEYSPRRSVFNIDDPALRQFAQELEDSGQELITVSCSDPGADLYFEIGALTQSGVRATLHYQGQKLEFASRLVGRHNLENLGTSLGLLLANGLSFQEAAAALSGAKGAPGRFQRVEAEEDDITVLVDYAHTPDAIERVIQALRELSAQPLITVFGCGGDRDRKKRPLMGKAASSSDAIWVTSDNPRSESPQKIVEEILQGVDQSATVTSVELDRKQAIQGAIAAAHPGSVVLIAGKGHEQYQEIAGERLSFDDVVVAVDALERRRNHVRGA